MRSIKHTALGDTRGCTGRAYPSKEGKSTLIDSAWTLWLVLLQFTSHCQHGVHMEPVKEEGYEGE